MARIPTMNFWNSSVCFLSWACKSSQRPCASKDHSIEIFQASHSESKHWSIFFWVQKRLENFGTTDLYIFLSSLLKLCNDDVKTSTKPNMSTVTVAWLLPYSYSPVAVELTFSVSRCQSENMTAFKSAWNTVWISKKQNWEHITA